MKFASALRHLDITIGEVRRAVANEERATLLMLETVRRALVEADHPEIVQQEHSLFSKVMVS